jgi:hypothetical protein
VGRSGALEAPATVLKHFLELYISIIEGRTVEPLTHLSFFSIRTLLCAFVAEASRLLPFSIVISVENTRTDNCFGVCKEDLEVLSNKLRPSEATAPRTLSRNCNMR